MALKFQSGLPDKCWGDYVMHAVYLIDQIPIPVLKDASPYEILFQKLLDYHHMRILRCLCFIGTLTALRHKFDPCSTKCIFLSFKLGIKGYKVLNKHTQQIFFSRDVFFYESHFLYVALVRSIDNDLFSQHLSHYLELPFSSFQEA